MWVLKDKLQGSAGVILTSIMYAVNNGQMKIMGSVTLWERTIILATKKTFQQACLVYGVTQIQSQLGSEL